MTAQPLQRETEDGSAQHPRAAVAVPVAGPPAQAEAGGERRRPLKARRVQPEATFAPLVERNWIYMAPTMLGIVATTALVMGQWPDWDVAALVSVACAPVVWSHRAASYEKTNKPGTAILFLLAAIVVGLPMLLFGTALTHWANAHGMLWLDVIGGFAVAASLASVVLSRQIPMILLSNLALWSPVVFAAGSVGGYIALAGGTGLAFYLGHRQAELQEERNARRRERERAQVRAEEILNDFEQTGQGWFWETDRRGTLVYLSPIIGEQLGRAMSDLLGRSLTDLTIQDPGGAEGERTLAFHLTARSAFSELALRAATREERWWSLTGRPLFDGFGNFLGFRGSGHDLTEKRRSQEQVTRLAHYDSLTGLANRLQMSQTLEKIITAPKLDHRACAVFLLDLDRFKQVNDTMGHPAGDSLLTQVATRLKRAVGEHGRVGRLGGDEFQIILAGSHRREDLANLARRIISDLSEPYSIEGHRVVIGVSIGIALSPDDGVTAEAIIRNADLALYAAKDAGRGRHHFYASDLHTDAEERRQLEQDLRDALTNGGLELHYQPVVHTVTERITGFEALLRWSHPRLGPLSPAKFIPIAEDAGLIAPIGEWALRKACHDLSTWPDNVRVAVNVSPLQFANPALPSIITSALANAQVDPSRLELEITESVFLNEGEGTDAMFAALKRVGVRLALDDFGTGYSSLGYLKKAPFDKIKIDQSFVRGATITGSRNGAIIASIVSLAESLGMETTAEGVETLDELDLVRMLGCSHVQGYIYDKPLPIADAVQRLTTGLTAIAKGPRAARAVRHTILRKIVLEHGGQSYHGTIRNISATGAMVEGLWNVPPGTIFRIMLAEGNVITATARWCQDDRMGVEFATPLDLDDHGSGSVMNGISGLAQRPLLRRQAGGA